MYANTFRHLRPSQLPPDWQATATRKRTNVPPHPQSCGRPSSPPWARHNPNGQRMRRVDQMSEAEIALGKLARSSCDVLRRLGWRRTVEALREASNVSVGVADLPHNAARVVDYLRRHGAPFRTTTSPWSRAQCDAAIARGPHKSSLGEREFVATEMLDFCHQGYWLVLPYYKSIPTGE